MQISRITAVLSACWFVSTASFADTLTFIAQPISGGGIDYSWFTAGNWFTTDTMGNLLPAGRVPLENETAIITGVSDLGGSGVRIQTMVETNNAIITNGTVAVENLQLLSSSSLANATVNVLTGLLVGGTNCTLNATTLNILGIASGTFQPIAPAKSSTLVLTNGAVLQNGGLLGLTDGSQISGGGLPQSKLVVGSGAVLSSLNSVVIRGSAIGHLVIDNSGTIRADGGTLAFTDGIDWQCSAGLQEFRATAPSALILFSNLFHSDTMVTSLFTGSGTNRWLAGATIDGTAQVSMLDPSTQLAGPGNLEILNSVTGAGMVHVLGTTNQGGAGAWDNGTLGVPSVTIDPGANLAIGGGGGTSRQIAACMITNWGSCVLLSGDLSFSQGAVLNNQASATFVVEGDGILSSADASGIFNNGGTFQKLSPGTLQLGVTNSMPGLAFNNNGLVDLESGQLNLLGGVSSGEFHQAPGTLLWFWGGPYIVKTGASFTGTSMVRVSEGAAPATFLVGDAITLPDLDLGLNGTLDASSAPPGILIHIGTLLARDNGVLSNGTFQVQSCQMLDESEIDLSSVSIVSTLTVGGTNCTLSSTTLSLQPGAFGLLQGVGSGVTLNLKDGAVVQNGGQLTMTDGSVIAGEGSTQSKLVIQTGGILVSTNSTMIQGSTNAPLILDNSGTIRVDGGALALADGLAFTSSGGTGEFNAAVANALVLFRGAFNVSNGTVSLFTGLGTNLWVGYGVIDGTAQVGAVDPVSQLARPGNLIIETSIAGTGFVHVLGGSTQLGNVDWNNGTLGMARLDVDNGGSLVIGGGTGTSRQLSGCALNNSGSCTFVSGNLVMGQGASINNLTGGNLRLQASIALTSAPGVGSGAINNAGSFLQSGNGTSTVAADFNNSGNLEIQTGAVNFQGAWKQTQGTTMIDGGALLGGTNLTVLGGTITGAGTISANLINSGGLVSPGVGIGILSTSFGDDYQQTALGGLTVDLGGTTPGTQYDQFAVGGKAYLDGQLQLQFINGFVPQVGQTFQILTCNSEVGRFASIGAPPLPGLVWVARYNATNVTLILAGNANVSRPSISGGLLTLPVNTTSGVVYVVQATDSLSTPDWQTISTLTGDGTVKTASDPTSKPQRFYRVVLQ
jgi:fibronectin-binding autotransporter adhesin